MINHSQIVEEKCPKFADAFDVFARTVKANQEVEKVNYVTLFLGNNNSVWHVVTRDPYKSHHWESTILAATKTSTEDIETIEALYDKAAQAYLKIYEKFVGKEYLGRR